MVGTTLSNRLIKNGVKISFARCWFFHVVNLLDKSFRVCMTNSNPLQWNWHILDISNELNGFNSELR